MAFLKAITGEGVGRVWDLPPSKVVLGRHPDCQIDVTHPAVSRHHAQIVFLDHAYYIEDLHSRNGTFVNDQPLRVRQQLQDGDQLRIVDAVFQFCVGSPRAPISQTSPAYVAERPPMNVDFATRNPHRVEQL